MEQKYAFIDKEFLCIHNGAVDDDIVIGDSIIHDLNEIESGPGSGAAEFSAKAQQDRFLGGTTENRGSQTGFSLRLTDIKPGGGLVDEKRTAVVDQSRDLIGTPEIIELAHKYRFLPHIARSTSPDSQAEFSAVLSEYVIENLNQALIEMPAVDELPDLSVSIPEGSTNASELTAKDLLSQYMFALGIRDILGDVVEIATDTGEVSTLGMRYPRQYLKVGLSLGQDDDGTKLVPYYSVIREGLVKESPAYVEERASEILEFTKETTGEIFTAGIMPSMF